MSLIKRKHFHAPSLLVLFYLLAATSTSMAQVSVHMYETTVRCAEPTIDISHVAKVVTNDRLLAKMVEALDLDSFRNDQPQIEISKEQVRIRLVLAGLSEDEFELSGPESVSVEVFQPQNARELIADLIKKQFAEHFRMSLPDVIVTLGPQSNDLARTDVDFSTLRIDLELSTEIPLGQQTVSGFVEDHSGQTVSIKIPVSIAVVRDLAVARKNISKGETLGPENIESVRRPVANRTIQFASYEQVVGSQVQKDVQQYDVIKSNLIQAVPVVDKLTVKRNSLVNIIVRRGALKVELKDAKALSEGSPGEPITVLNPSTKEKILAIVVNSSTVEIR